MRYWLVPPETLRHKCLEFIILEGYFNPKTFSELEYSLHNQEYPHRALIRELCRNVRRPEICEKCQATCAWKELCIQVKNLHIERSPPCIQKAYRSGMFRLVEFYFRLLGVLPNTKKRNILMKCDYMKKKKLCNPDIFCKSIKTGNLTEYYNIRLRKKIANR
ncbi:MAG: hypothetical protein ACTSWF_03815 [Candidatus Freyarchaeota archaeon]